MFLAIALAPIVGLFLLILFSPFSAVWSASLALLGALLIAVTVGRVEVLSLVDLLVPQFSVFMLTVAAVVIPGLLFVCVTSQSGAADGLKDWISGWRISNDTKIVVIVIGVATAVESMTGFGVSMVITIPILLNMLSRDRALLIGLLGMNIMPWGTLGLATIVGAAIAGVAPSELGYHTAIASFLVFPITALEACLIAGYKSARALALATTIGFTFSASLVVSNYLIGPSIAGVVSGLTVITGVLFASHVRHQRLRAPDRVIAPYVCLIAFVVIERILWVSVPGLQDVGLSSGQFSWKVFESPGLPLVLACLVAGVSSRDLWHSTRKAVKPLLSVGLLLAMSQVMTQGGQMHVIAEALKSVSGTGGVALFAPFSALSGYVAGSNVGANALLMPTANILDGTDGIAYAAVQNSAAGHAVLASISIVVLLLGIAGGHTKGEEAWLLRRGALLAAVNTISIGILGMLLI